MDCIFCKIAENKVPNYKFYEDKNFIGFLAIPPLNKGHVLVIPKKHYRWVWDYPKIGNYFEVVQKIVMALKRVFDTDFVIGAQVGEEVPHAHVALIPRYKDDGHGDFLNPGVKKPFTSEEMVLIAKSIEDNLT